MANIKSFYDYEVAMIEHEFIKEGEILETCSERNMCISLGYMISRKR